MTGPAERVSLTEIQKQYHCGMAASTARLALLRTDPVLPIIVGSTSSDQLPHPTHNDHWTGPALSVHDYSPSSVTPSTSASPFSRGSWGEFGQDYGQSQSRWSDLSDIIETPLRRTLALDQPSLSPIDTYPSNFQYTNYPKNTLYTSLVSSLPNQTWNTPDGQCSIPIDTPIRFQSGISQGYKLTAPPWLRDPLPSTGPACVPLIAPVSSSSYPPSQHQPALPLFPPRNGYYSHPPVYGGFGLGLDGMLLRGNANGAVSSVDPRVLDSRRDEGLASLGASGSLFTRLPSCGCEISSPLPSAIPNQREYTSALSTPQLSTPLITRRPTSRRHSTPTYTAQTESEAEEKDGQVRRGRKRKAEQEEKEDTAAVWENIADKKERRKIQNKLAQRARRARTRQ